MLALCPELFVQLVMTAAGLDWPLAMFSPLAEVPQSEARVQGLLTADSGAVWSKKECSAMWMQ